MAPPGQTEIETLRLFGEPLGARDGGPESLYSTFLRGHNLVDHVTYHEMENRRRHIQEFIRKQMEEKEQAPRTNLKEEHRCSESLQQRSM